MHIRILGSAAGGGVPQWNCRCANCEAVRAGSPHVRPRTQSSLAISADERNWFLLNVSPDVRQQILAFPPLGPPQGKLRGQSIAGCVLTDAELDHTAGLLLLREGQSFSIFTTMLVRSWLSRFFQIEPILACFSRPSWVDLPLDQTVVLKDSQGQDAGLLLRAFEIDRHVPRFIDEKRSTAVGSVCGLFIQDRTTGGKLVYAPCVGWIKEPLIGLAQEADGILFDGTFWSNEEPIHCGIGQRTALQMGHIPVSGWGSSLEWLSTLSARHRVYIHINNTNPMLNEEGPEFRLVNDSGVRVGADGDMFVL